MNPETMHGDPLLSEACELLRSAVPQVDEYLRALSDPKSRDELLKQDRRYGTVGERKVIEHFFGNKLTPILGMIEIISGNTGNEEQYSDRASTIARAVHESERIEDVLMMTRNLLVDILAEVDTPQQKIA